MDQVEPGGAREGRHRDVRSAAVAARAVVELAGMLAGVVDQLGHRVRRHRWVHHEHVGQPRHHADGREVGDRVVGELRIERRIEGQRADMAEQQRVPVGVGLGDGGAGDRSRQPRPVVDHHRLAEAVRHLLADDPAEEIGRSAGRERHDQGHGP